MSRVVKSQRNGAPYGAEPISLKDTGWVTPTAHNDDNELMDGQRVRPKPQAPGYSPIGQGKATLP